LLPPAQRESQEKMGEDIPLYLLHEDALDSDDFQARNGDLLLGGGSGECSAFWIGMPDALLFFTGDTEETIELWPSDMYPTIGDMHDSVYHAFWSPTESYFFCGGYAKAGWQPLEDSIIEIWLVQHILAFVTREYPDFWNHLLGPDELWEDGSICRLPTSEEKSVW